MKFSTSTQITSENPCRPSHHNGTKGCGCLRCPTEALGKLNPIPPLPQGRLYSCWDIRHYRRLCKMHEFRLYLNHFNRIDVPLSQKSFGNLHTITVDGTLDEASVQNLLPFIGHLTVLGTEPATMAIRQHRSINASSINLPEVKFSCPFKHCTTIQVQWTETLVEWHSIVVQDVKHRHLESFSGGLQLKGLKG